MNTSPSIVYLCWGLKEPLSPPPLLPYRPSLALTCTSLSLRPEKEVFRCPSKRSENEEPWKSKGRIFWSPSSACFQRLPYWCQFLEHLPWLYCKTLSKNCLILPHVCTLGLLCNLETCNVTNRCLPKEKFWTYTNPVFLWVPQASGETWCKLTMWYVETLPFFCGQQTSLSLLLVARESGKARSLSIRNECSFARTYLTLEKLLRGNDIRKQMICSLEIYHTLLSIVPIDSVTKTCW